DRVVGEQQVVARMRVAERDPVAVEKPEEEPEHDLAVAVAGRLVGAAYGLEALALQILGDEHAPGAQLGPDPRHAHERMVAQQPPDPALVLGLELIIELLADP